MRSHRPMLLTGVDEKRFWSKVALPDANGCMLWLGGIDPGGYGRFKLAGHEGRAGRASLQIAVGPPPSAFEQSAHSCRNRHCVAPAHLRWASPIENQRDKVKDGTDGRGERNPRAKLTWDQVREIRRRVSRGALQTEVAVDYSVSKSLINQIVLGLCWVESDEDEVAS